MVGHLADTAFIGEIAFTYAFILGALGIIK